MSMNSKHFSRKDMTTSQFHDMWVFGNQLGGGGYGKIFKVMEKKTGRVYAIKCALEANDKSIEKEAGVYEEMKKRGRRRGCAIMHSYGKIDGKNYLIMNVLGESMLTYSRSVNHGNGLELGFVIQFGISGLRTISYLHTVGFLHKDVKPDNFVRGEPGTEDEDIVHLIDFGAANKFETGEGNEKRHISFQMQEEFYPGTSRYGTANQNDGYTATRRDDLESLFYSIVVLFKSNLPWDTLVQRSRGGKISRAAIIDMKRTLNPALLCQGMPYQMQIFLTYVKSLGASDRPDYEFLERCLQDAYTEACRARPAE